ncbi:hypothetical protein MTO96_026436 [Rhipicephalus appendiculatus]
MDQAIANDDPTFNECDDPTFAPVQWLGCTGAVFAGRAEQHACLAGVRGSCGTPDVAGEDSLGAAAPAAVRSSGFSHGVPSGRGHLTPLQDAGGIREACA